MLRALPFASKWLPAILGPRRKILQDKCGKRVKDILLGVYCEMKTKIVIICTVWVALASGPFAQDKHAQAKDDQTMHTHHPSGESNGTQGVITGYVRDVACLLRNSKAGAAMTPLAQDCMQKCVGGGSPVGILTEEGMLYLSVSDLIPDKDARSKLVPYVGKYVKASGALLERGGLHAIAIENVDVIDRPADSKIPTS